MALLFVRPPHVGLHGVGLREPRAAKVLRGGLEAGALRAARGELGRDSPHVKISDYHVVRNDENAYSWKIDTVVTGKDYKAAWKAEKDEDVLVSIENGCIILKNPEEETGAYLKLPKKANAGFEPIVDKPPRGGLFVTMGKTGAKAAPAPARRASSAPAPASSRSARRRSRTSSRASPRSRSRGRPRAARSRAASENNITMWRAVCDTTLFPFFVALCVRPTTRA